MIWSNWRGAVLILAAWVVLTACQGLAQSPRAIGKVEQYMTVHENGQRIRCKLMGTWQLADSSRAYQLQAVEGGQMLTVVESVASDSFDHGAKLRPMKIYHWNADRTPARGAPVPPREILTQLAPPPETIQVKSEVKYQSPTPAQGGSRGKETVVWWEEGKGSSNNPQGVATVDSKRGLELPGQATTPVATDKGVAATLPASATQEVRKPGVIAGVYTRNAQAAPQMTTATTVEPTITTPIVRGPGPVAGERRARLLTTSPIADTPFARPQNVVIPKNAESASMPGRPTYARPLYVPNNRSNGGLGVIVPTPGARVVNVAGMPADKVVVQTDPTAPAAQVMQGKTRGGVDTHIGPIAPVFGSFSGRQHARFARSNAFADTMVASTSRPSLVPVGMPSGLQTAQSTTNKMGTPNQPSTNAPSTRPTPSAPVGPPATGTPVQTLPPAQVAHITTPTTTKAYTVPSKTTTTAQNASAPKAVATTSNDGPMLPSVEIKTPPSSNRLAMAQGTPSPSPRTIQSQDNASFRPGVAPTMPGREVSVPSTGTKATPPAAQPGLFARMFGRPSMPEKKPAPTHIAQNKLPAKEFPTAPVSRPATTTFAQDAVNTPLKNVAPAGPRVSSSAEAAKRGSLPDSGPARTASVDLSKPPVFPGELTTQASSGSPAKSISQAPHQSTRVASTTPSRNPNSQNAPAAAPLQIPLDEGKQPLTNAEIAAQVPKVDPAKRSTRENWFGKSHTETKVAQGPTDPAPRTIESKTPARTSLSSIAKERAAANAAVKSHVLAQAESSKTSSFASTGSSSKSSQTASTSTDKLPSSEKTTRRLADAKPSSRPLPTSNGMSSDVLFPKSSNTGVPMPSSPPPAEVAKTFETKSTAAAPGETWSLPARPRRKIGEAITKKKDGTDKANADPAKAKESSTEPGKSDDLPRPPDTNKPTTPESLPPATTVVKAGSGARKERTPFTTSAPGDAPETLPRELPTAPRTVVEAKAPAATPNSGALQTPKEPVKSVVQTAQRRDWRHMWGKAPQNGAQPPGQSVLEQVAGTKTEGSGIMQAGYNVPANDPLMNPEKFIPAAKLDQKSNAYLAASKVDPHLQQVGYNVQQAGGRMPAGVNSVLAAGNGLMTPVTYVPVPIVTMPDSTKVPVPPEPKIPAAPQPAEYVNAFSPPQQAGGPPVPTQNSRMPVNQAMMAQAYAQNPYLTNPAMLHQGIQQFAQLPAAQQAMVQQALFYQQQTFMLQQQALFLQQQQTMMRNPGYPANYGGPQPPNPVTAAHGYAPVAQASYGQTQPYAGQQQSQAVQNPSVQQLISVLIESPYPAQREWAAGNLATYNWRSHPQILNVLLQAARQDPAASVRAGCIYSLSRMNASTEPVMTTLQSLQTDPDPRVRHEVQQAVARMNGHHGQ